MAEAERHLRSRRLVEPRHTLNSFKANASFVWDHTYSIGFGYFNITGSSDCNMYGSAATGLHVERLGAFKTASEQPKATG